MDLLAKAYARAHYARQIPISPKIKPPSAAAAALVEIASLPPPRPESYARHLPGVAPWREQMRSRPVPVIAPVPRVASVREIIAAVAAHFEMTPEQLKGSYRTQRIAFARHVAQYLAQRLTRQSLPIISRIFFRDHTSVLHAIRKIGRMIDEDTTVRELVERLEKELRGQP